MGLGGADLGKSSSNVQWVLVFLSPIGRTQLSTLGVFAGFSASFTEARWQKHLLTLNFPNS